MIALKTLKIIGVNLAAIQLNELIFNGGVRLWRMLYLREQFINKIMAMLRQRSILVPALNGSLREVLHSLA